MEVLDQILRVFEADMQAQARADCIRPTPADRLAPERIAARQASRVVAVNAGRGRPGCYTSRPLARRLRKYATRIIRTTPVASIT